VNAFQALHEAWEGEHRHNHGRCRTRYLAPRNARSDCLFPCLLTVHKSQQQHLVIIFATSTMGLLNILPLLSRSRSSFY
jgi:hypothetical protein